MNREGKCVFAGAHSESDSATDAGTNRCPQGVPKMSQIRSVGSGNVLASEPRPSPFMRSVISRARAECNCEWANSAINGEGLGSEARNVLHNANTDLFEVDAIVSFKASFGLPVDSLVTRPHPQEGERVWYITSEFLVVLSQHVQKTGNPIRLLDLQQSCDMKEN